MLQRDVDNAQKAYDTVFARSNQTQLESQNTQSNINLLTEPNGPTPGNGNPIPYAQTSRPTAAFASNGRVYIAHLAHDATKNSGSLMVRGYTFTGTAPVEVDLDPVALAPGSGGRVAEVGQGPLEGLVDPAGAGLTDVLLGRHHGVEGAQIGRAHV